jgi:2'-5' RNA ligase
MTLLRAFIALEIPAPLQEAIRLQTAGLREAAGSSAVRWVPAHNLHLTLKFLGDVSAANLPFLNQMLGLEAASHHCFNLKIAGLGCFPSAKRARVVWVGIQAPPEMQTLQHSVETGAERLGYATEERGFSPHLTIGRVRQGLAAAEQQRLRSALEATRIGTIGNADIRSVTLMKSDLQPSGSIYTRLFSADLAPS